MTFSSTISKFERGLITSSNLFLISYGLLIGIKASANDDGQIILTTCEPTDKKPPHCGVSRFCKYPVIKKITFIYYLTSRGQEMCYTKLETLRGARVGVAT